MKVNLSFWCRMYTCQLSGNPRKLKPSVGVAMVASFNFSSAVSRISLGLLCDFFGPLKMLFVMLSMAGISMLVVWPFSNSLAPLAVFTIWNSVASGGFSHVGEIAVTDLIALNGFGTSSEGLVFFPHACNQFCSKRIRR
jgi:nitrate/nitrite transporter NarK